MFCSFLLFFLSFCPSIQADPSLSQERCPEKTSRSGFPRGPLIAVTVSCPYLYVQTSASYHLPFESHSHMHTLIFIFPSALLSIHHCHLDHHRHSQTLSPPGSPVSATTTTTLFVQTSAICRPPLLAVLDVPQEIQRPNQHPQRHRPFPPQQASRHL